MKTFTDLLGSERLFESSNYKNAEKTLGKMHKVQLEIQDLQRVILDLYYKVGKDETSYKERIKLEENVEKLIQKKKDFEEELQSEKMTLQRLLIALDHYDDIEKFF